MKQHLSINDVQAIIRPAFGKLCCRKQVGYRRSLSLGFGEKVPHQNPKARDRFYGEWEIGTYNSAWRIMQAGKILCASHDPVDAIENLDANLSNITFTRLVAVQQLTELDIRVVLDLELTIDFFAAISDNDEVFHVFCPLNQYVEFTAENGWITGVSNTPWNK